MFALLNTFLSLLCYAACVIKKSFGDRLYTHIHTLSPSPLVSLIWNRLILLHRQAWWLAQAGYKGGCYCFLKACSMPLRGIWAITQDKSALVALIFYPPKSHPLEQIPPTPTILSFFRVESSWWQVPSLNFASSLEHASQCGKWIFQMLVHGSNCLKFASSLGDPPILL